MRFGFLGNNKSRTKNISRRPRSLRSIEQLETRRLLTNTPPNLAPIDNTTGVTGTEIVVPLTVSDTETAAAELFVMLDPDDSPITNVVVDNTTRTLRWTPTAEQVGAFRFVVLVTDRPAMGSPALADAEEFIITVTAGNQAPVNTVPGAQTVAEDTDLIFSTANNNRISIADADAGTASVQVTLSVTNGDLTLSGIVGLTFTAGDGTDDATMTFTGTITAINTALEGLRFGPTANFSGAATLTITTNDQGNTGSGGAQSDTDTVAITVTPVADTPTITTATTEQDTQTTSGLVVARNAADGPEVTHFKITGISNGTLFQNDGVTEIENGDFITFAQASAGLRFTPTAGFVGTGTFQLQASTSATDAGLGGLVVPALVTVFPDNDAPDLADITNRMVERGQTVTFTATATDPDGDNIVFSIDPEMADLGATIDPETGVFSWTPDDTQPLGQVTFRIIATDDGTPALADSETFVITVNDSTANAAPVFTSTPVTTATEDQPYSYSITATDADDDDLAITAESIPGWLALTDNLNGTATLTGTPNSTHVGPQNVVLMVSDGITETPQAFTIIVAAVNQAPVLAEISPQTGNVGSAVTFTATADDADDQELTFTLGDGAPDGASIDAETGVFTWTPTTAGSFTISVIVSDDATPSLSDQQDVTITVS